MPALLETAAETALEMCDAVGWMPFGMQQHRQIVNRGHGREIAGQRNVIRFVVNIVAAAARGGVEAACQQPLPGSTQGAPGPAMPTRSTGSRSRRGERTNAAA